MYKRGVHIPTETGSFEGERGVPQGHCGYLCETAEPVEMPIGLWTRMGPRNDVLDGGPDPPREGVIFRGEEAARCKASHTVLSCANG